jgi:hypothetical protein
MEANERMKVVSRFEANLIRIVRFFLRGVPAHQALPLVTNPCAQPRCLSRDAVQLVQDTLAKGCVRLLARDGGWRPARHLRGADPVHAVGGRLWERTAPAELALTFSGETMRFLLWVTAAQLPNKKHGPGLAEDKLTTGDRFVLYLAYAALRGTAVGPMFWTQPLYQRHGLCRLAYPQDFLSERPPPAPDFAPWTTGLGACIVEALQAELTRRCLDTEALKPHTTDRLRLRLLGESQERALTAFLDAVDPAGRRDLARFLLEVLAALLRGRLDKGRWISDTLNLDGLRLADRARVYRAALAVLKQADRLRAWQQGARDVGYWDEGYAASQLWKADWEVFHGDALVAQAREIVRQTEVFSPGPN